MARKLSVTDVIRYLTKNDPRGKPSNYDWDRWLDGNIWLIEQGKDFHNQNPYNFAQCIRVAANKRKYRVHVYQHPQGVLVVPYGKLFKEG